MLIRPETPADKLGIQTVNQAAFQNDQEAMLVDKLRETANPIVSLVAEESAVIIGHILFTPVHLLTNPELSIMGLGPMAVEPTRQNTGIGAALVAEGLKQCKTIGVEAIVVLGHPDYYPRFGFVKASKHGIECAYDAPDEAFMALELQPEALKNNKGPVEYHEAFDTFE
jgi:putative acetyltransferase